jgi:hypothetical protein
MKTRYHKKKYNRKNKTRKNMKGGKKWKTAIQAAQATLKKTGSLEKAKVALNKQALFNARKLFGSV